MTDHTDPSSDARKRNAARGVTFAEAADLIKARMPRSLATPDQENPMSKTDRHDELVALLTEIRDRLPERDKPEVYRCIACGEKYLAKLSHDCPTPDGQPEPAEVTEEPTPADDLPGEPVEPGDLRAGDKVGFTWEGTGERITCALRQSVGGSVLTSDTPLSSGYHPNVVWGGEWCYEIFDVRLIERAPREDEDPDEAGCGCECHD